MSTLDEAQPLDTFEDIPAEFRPVAQKYGRELYSTVLAIGLSRQAAEKLYDFVAKHHSRHALIALQTLLDSYNGMSSGFVASRGWTEELLAQCDRDLQLAWAGKLVTVERKLVLDS